MYNLSSLNIIKGYYDSMGYGGDNGAVARYALDVYTSTSSASKLDKLSYPGYIFYIDGEVRYLVNYTGSETTITLPESYKGQSYAINKYAFSGCTGLTSVTIPDSVTSIGDDAFSRCTGLTSITIPDSVTSIGSSAFYYCTGLTSVTIPDSVTSIGSSAFYYCTGLTSITIPDSVTSIGSSAFYGCKGLTSITIPDSVTSIGSDAFSGCTGLIQIEDGVSYVDKWVVDCDTSMTTVALRNNTVGIGERAFYGCTGLTSITIPDSVTSIGDYAFSGCYRLVEVYNLSALSITSGSRDHGYVAYYALDVYTSTSNASKLDKTSYPGYIFYIDGDTRYLVDYTGAEADITLPESYNGQSYEIYKYAFYQRTDLISITIPDGVTSIGSYAFSSCTGLESMTFTDTSTWYRTISSSNWSNQTGGTETDVTDPAKNATYFKSTYYNYYWYKQ